MKKKAFKEKVKKALISLDVELSYIINRLRTAQSIHATGENKPAVDMLIDEAVNKLNELKF